MVDDDETRRIVEALRRIPGVRDAAVGRDARREMDKIHLITDGSKPAKGFTRDVEAVLAIQFGIEIDHRIVSVVELRESAAGPRPAAGAGGSDGGDRRPPIPGIFHLALTTDPEGRVVEVHVVSDGSRPPRDVAAAVAAAMAELGYAAPPPQAISVVEVAPEPPDPEPPAGAPRPAPPEPGTPRLRPALVNIEWRSTPAGGEVEVVVTLTIGPHVLTGRASGPAGPANRPRIVARATLAAVVELLGVPAEVESVQVVDAGAHQVALVVIALEIPRLGTQVLVGSAVVRGDLDDAVARAVLAALNRQLAG